MPLEPPRARSAACWIEPRWTFGWSSARPTTPARTRVGPPPVASTRGRHHAGGDRGRGDRQGDAARGVRVTAPDASRPGRGWRSWRARPHELGGQDGQAGDDDEDPGAREHQHEHAGGQHGQTEHQDHEALQVPGEPAQHDGRAAQPDARPPAWRRRSGEVAVGDPTVGVDVEAASSGSGDRPIRAGSARSVPFRGDQATTSARRRLVSTLTPGPMVDDTVILLQVAALGRRPAWRAAARRSRRGSSPPAPRARS